MKKIILLVGLALAGVAAWYFWETRPKPDHEIARTPAIIPSKLSGPFNQSIDSMLQAYYSLSDAFVAWDSTKVAAQTAQLKQQISSLKTEELKSDTLIFQSAQPTLQSVQQNVTDMESAATLEGKRRAFHALSQNMYDLLRTVRYDAATVYLQECPMAFNEVESGNWLSHTTEIRNPYLGLHHPKYKSGMLECGETKDSIAFATAR